MSEKLYLEGGAMWVNEVELLRQYGTMRGNQSMIFPKSQATWANQPVADNSLIWQRLAPKHLLARLTRTLSNSGVKQSRQALPGWAKSSVKRRRRTSFIESSERTEVYYVQMGVVGLQENQKEISLTLDYKQTNNIGNLRQYGAMPKFLCCATREPKGNGAMSP